MGTNFLDGDRPGHFPTNSRHPTAPNCAIGPPYEHPGGACLRL